MTPLLSGDHDTIHLFALELPEDELWSFVTEDPETGEFALRDALGVESLDESQVEGAVTEDLHGIGLSGFLTEGIGVDEALISDDRARIDALSGGVVIVKGGAFASSDIALHPRPPLRHVGTYRLPDAPSTLEQLTSESARRTGGETAEPVAASPQSNQLTRRLIIAIVVLIVLGLLVGVLA